MNQSIKYRILLISLLILNLTTFGQTKIYVSPDGMDTQPGTIDQPFKTLQRAQKEVRKNNKRMKSDITIYLREGEYKLTSPLQFSERDGGTNGYHVIYSAHAEETPIITGGERITGWKLFKDGIWVAAYDGPFFRQLYVNNERRTRAREPNAEKYFQVVDYDFKHKEILAHRGDVNSLLGKKINAMEMILQMHWAESILRVRSIGAYGPYNVKNANISIHPEDAQIIFNRPHPGHRAGQSYHFENALSFLDQSGEWFLDKKEGKVYYKPFENETLKNTAFIAPEIENLVVISGEKGSPVKNMVFDGLNFMYSNWKRPGNDTYANIQAGLFILNSDSANNNTVLRPPSAVHVTWAHNLVFRNNRFSNLGSTGLDLNYGTHNCIIEGNVFKDIAGGGIMVGKFVKDSATYINGPYNPSDKRIISTGNVVKNNFITMTGCDYYGTCGIAAGFTDNIQILHNYIYNVPYTGISVGYGWTNEEKMNILADGAGIYTLSKQPGTIIKENYIHDLKKSSWASPWPMAGIYLDNSSGGTLERPLIVEKNVVDVNFNEGKPFIFGKKYIVLLVNNYMRPTDENECRKIMNEAGLEEDFIHIVPAVMSIK